MSSPVVQHAQVGSEAQAQERLESVLPTLFGEGYNIYKPRRESFVISFLLNVLFTTLAVALGSYVATHQEQVKMQVVELIGGPSLPLPIDEKPAGGGGGGGDRDKLDAPKGAIPKASTQQIAPPQIVVRNDNPKLVVEPTVVAPQLTMPAANLGDPLSGVTGTLSNGTGSGGGVGSGSGGGIGTGRGPGVGPGWGGGYGGGAYRVGGGVSAPRALFQPDPEYSEEARKAKWQGTVVLWVVVGPDGRPHEIRVQRSLGMGLDEKAIEAVKQWKFDPAKKDGQPVAVQINVEVNFHLY